MLPSKSIRFALRTVILPFCAVYLFAGSDFWSFVQGSLIYWSLNLLVKFYARGCKSRRRKEGKPDDPLTILLAGDAFPPKVDGVATFASHAIQDLQTLGHTVHVLTSVTKTPTLFGARVTRLPGTYLKYAPEHSISFPVPFTCFKLLYNLKPDVVHLFEFSFLTPVMAIYCWFADIPCCWSHHTRIDLYLTVVEFPWYIPTWLQFGIYNMFDPFCTSFADGQMAVCKTLRDKYEKVFGFENVRLWQTGVSDRFLPSNYDQETRNTLSGGKPELPLILHVGRISPDKQSDQLFPMLNAFYKKMNGQVRFAIVGDGQIRQIVQEQFESAKIPCCFTGFLTGDPLKKAFASADVFFSPSTMEGYPIVFLEAMRSGLACVCPENTGSADTFEDGVHGCYYKNEGLNAIDDACAALKKAIDNKKNYGKAATEYVQRSTWPAASKQLEEMLRFLANKRLDSSEGSVKMD